MHIRAILLGTLIAAAPIADAALAQPSKTTLRREASAPPEIRAKLQAMRQEIRQQRLPYQVGFTRALERPRASLLGDEDDPLFTPARRAEVQERANQLIKLDDDIRRDLLLKNPRLRRTLPDILVLQLACNANNSSFSWRAAGKVTPVKDQICGNCWSFAALGAYEASDRIRNNRTLEFIGAVHQRLRQGRRRRRRRKLRRRARRQGAGAHRARRQRL